MADSPKDREADRDRSIDDGIDRRTFLQQGGRAAIGLGTLGVAYAARAASAPAGASNHPEIRAARQDRARHLGHRFRIEWLPERRHRSPLL